VVLAPQFHFISNFSH